MRTFVTAGSAALSLTSPDKSQLGRMRFRKPYADVCAFNRPGVTDLGRVINSVALVAAAAG